MTAIDPWSELATLTAALCEGEITPAQAARLESLASQSDEARRFFLHYVQLHGELHWDHAAGVEPARRPASGPRGGFRRAGRLARWIAAAAAAAVILAAGVWLATRFSKSDEGGHPASVARLAAAVEAKWAREAREIGAELSAGARLELDSGLAELEFASGARAILEGPARCEVRSADRVFLHSGRLTARVPAEAAGFSAATAGFSVVDRGTEFGLAVEDGGGGEVQVFAGAVEVGPEDLGPAAAAPWARLAAGQAARVLPGARPEAQRIEPLPLRGADFVRSLPEPGAGSVAAMRRLVAADPRLIHHYTLEGASMRERLRDRRRGLDLTEAVMRDGRGAGGAPASLVGFDGTTRGVALHRARRDGNSQGAALQSETSFLPPPELTVELLAKLDPDGLGEGAVAAAVATRGSQKQCGFLLAAVDHGRPAHLLDGDAPWLIAADDFTLAPGDWHYLAATFRVRDGRTLVNCYAANLSRGEASLAHLVRDRWVPGAPAASRLGIGKAFDADLAHAYPWPGELDEVAVYDAVLGPADLEGHLRAVVEGRQDNQNGGRH